MLKLYIIIVITLCQLTFLLLLKVVVPEAPYTASETHCVGYNGDCESLNLGVSIVREVPDEPPVALADQVNEDPVEEEGHENDA